MDGFFQRTRGRAPCETPGRQPARREARPPGGRAPRSAGPRAAPRATQPLCRGGLGHACRRRHPGAGTVAPGYGRPGRGVRQGHERRPAHARSVLALLRRAGAPAAEVRCQRPASSACLLPTSPTTVSVSSAPQVAMPVIAGLVAVLRVISRSRSRSPPKWFLCIGVATEMSEHGAGRMRPDYPVDRAPTRDRRLVCARGPECWPKRTARREPDVSKAQSRVR